MKATDILIEEHRIIERALNSVEAAVNRLENGLPVQPDFFLSAVDFMRNYADRCHHEKEEDILFKFIVERGVPEQGCPLGVMLAEHALGRQYVLALLSAAQGMQYGDEGAKQRAIESARSYIALLRQHIRKEDTILFPMAEQVIPLDRQAVVWERFERSMATEAILGVQEKYTSVVEVLELETNR